MLGTISAEEYRSLFTSDEEFAVVDARETNLFYQGHMLAASSIPASRLEIDMPLLVPGRSTHVVLCDWESAAACHETLARLGYTRVSVIAGGLSGWHLAGGRIFQGWNAIGKAFGSYVFKTRATPIIDAPTLKGLIESDQPPFIIDTRTPVEHSEYCIPGAISCPNGDTVYRALAAIKDPDQLVVTHCAGHTRGIMGAQTLIDAGIANKVVSLNLGTLEWAIDGLDLEWDACRPMPVPDDPQPALNAIAEMTERHPVSRIDHATLDSWENERGSKTLIVIDIRSREEYEFSSWPGARHVVGSQVLQSADQHLVSRNVRTVLLDTDGVRGATLAYWLTQMGYRNIHVCTLPLSALEKRSESPPQPRYGISDLEDLGVRVDEGKTSIVDVRGGVKYRRSHVKGSWLLGRANLSQDITHLPTNTEIAVLTDEPAFGELVAGDLAHLGRKATVFANPLDAWAAAGFELESGVGKLASEPHDAVYDLEELDIHVRDSHEYILWRENLYYIIEGDPAAPYMERKGERQ